MECQSNLNSIRFDMDGSVENDSTSGALPMAGGSSSGTSAGGSGAISAGRKHSLPRIPLGMFNLTTTSPLSPPPLPSQQSSPGGNLNRNGLHLDGSATGRVQGSAAGKKHRPVVRSQSSRVSLLRQPPASASSLTSGTDLEQHFPMPDKYVEYRKGRCSPWYWWCPLTVLCSIATMVIIFWLSQTYGWLNMMSVEESSSLESDTCASPACIRAAARLLARLDPSTDPCTDFYKFSCGRFLETYSVPDDSNQLSTLQEMQDEMLLSTRRVLEQPHESDATDGSSIRKIKDFYASCMSSQLDDADYGEVRHLPLFAFLQPGQIGAWPLLMLGDEVDVNDDDDDGDEEGSASEPSNGRPGSHSGGRGDHYASLEHLIGMLASYQVHSFVDIYVTQDERNSSQYVLQFYKGEPLMEKEWYDVSKEETASRHSRYLRSYRNLMEETVLLLSDGRREGLAELDDVLAFETQFAKISANFCAEGDLIQDVPISESNRSSNGSNDEMDPAFGSDISSDHRMSLADMENQFPSINWTAAVETLLKATGLSEEDRLSLLASELPVSLQCRDFLPELGALLSSTPSRTITNYLVWRFVFKSMPLITTRFQKMWTQFRLSVPNLGEDRIYLTRWKQCVSLVNEGFGLVAAHLYVTKLAADWTNTWILLLIDELKEAFGASITNQTWIEEAMAQRLLEKLDAMGSKIGYPSKILNLTQLDLDYQDLHIDKGHVLFNVMRMRKHEVWREIQKAIQQSDKEKEWLVQPLVVNAFHNPSTNEIIFPLGILREPFFNLQLPRYMTYGNLGVVIGHEIVHGFDVNGRRYDRHGNMTHWWSDGLMREFSQRADCFIQQYSAFAIGNINKTVDGNRTLGENICDSGGLAHSWTAYKNSKRGNGLDMRLPGVNYTDDQLFFITYGQIWCEVLNPDGYEKYTKEAHSPGQYRANGVLQNSATFAQVFQCPVGSPMNPVNKCQLWS